MAILPESAQTQPERVQVKCVSGHTGIEGNEEADKEAKMGYQAPLGLPRPPVSPAATKHAAQRVHWRLSHNSGQKRPPQTIQGPWNRPRKRPLALHLPRPALGHLLAAKHNDALMTCLFGHRKEHSHFYFCREGRKAAAHPWGQQPVTDILTKKTGFTAYADWLAKSQVYTAICKRH